MNLRDNSFALEESELLQWDFSMDLSPHLKAKNALRVLLVQSTKRANRMILVLSGIPQQHLYVKL